MVRAVGDSEWAFRLRHDLRGLIAGPQKSRIKAADLIMCVSEIIKIVVDVSVIRLG